MSLSILDGRDEFWQWDTNQQLLVEDTTCGMVHYCNGTGDCALIVTIKTLEDGRRVAAVPNILLQTSGFIMAYLYQIDELGARTRKDYRFRVMPRSRPADYVYTENDVYAYLELESRVGALEENLDKQAAEAVKKYLEENPPSGGGGTGAAGENGATFTPSLAEDGTLSWSNDKNLPNPDPVNIQGPQGERGETGPQGPAGPAGPAGDAATGEQIAQAVEDYMAEHGQDSGGNANQGTGWTTAQIDLLDSLFSAIPWTTGTAGALADSLIASLRSTSSGSGGTGGGSGGESGGEDEPETGATDNITQSGNTLIITSLATAPIQSGSVLTIA